MPKLLTTGEMMDLWLKVRDRATPRQRVDAMQSIQEAEQAFTQLGRVTSEIIGVKAGDAALDVADMCGLCVPFYPSKDGDLIPEELHEFDAGADWNEEDSPLPEGGD